MRYKEDSDNILPPDFTANFQVPDSTNYSLERPDSQRANRKRAKASGQRPRPTHNQTKRTISKTNHVSSLTNEGKDRIQRPNNADVAVLKTMIEDGNSNETPIRFYERSEASGTFQTKEIIPEMMNNQQRPSGTYTERMYTVDKKVDPNHQTNPAALKQASNIAEPNQSQTAFNKTEKSSQVHTHQSVLAEKTFYKKPVNQMAQL